MDRFNSNEDIRPHYNNLAFFMGQQARLQERPYLSNPFAARHHTKVLVDSWYAGWADEDSVQIQEQPPCQPPMTKVDTAELREGATKRLSVNIGHKTALDIANELDTLRRQIEHDLRYKMQLIGKIKEIHKDRVSLRQRIAELEAEHRDDQIAIQSLRAELNNWSIEDGEGD